MFSDFESLHQGNESQQHNQRVSLALSLDSVDFSTLLPAFAPSSSFLSSPEVPMLQQPCHCMLDALLCPSCYSGFPPLQLSPMMLEDPQKEKAEEGVQLADGEESSLSQSGQGVLKQEDAVVTPVSSPAKRRSKKGAAPKKRRKKATRRKDDTSSPSASSSEERSRKRKKASSKAAGKRAVITAENIPRDPDGKPTLPVKIGSNFRLISLGRLEEGPGWIVHSVPLPVGYASERIFHSLADPTQKVWWRSEVLKGEDGVPRFKVSDPLGGEPFIDTSMGRVWTDVAKAVRTLQKRSTRSVLSGPKSFGFDRPIVRDLIAEMVEGSDTFVPSKAKRKRTATTNE